FVIPPPSQFNQHISPELDATILRALAESPSDRFGSGEEMAAALLAHVPREAGKLALGEFVRSLFESDMRTEAAEREALVAGATALRETPAPAGPGQTSSSEDSVRDPLLGTVLTDRYFVRRLVGEGAMGRVYEGHHTGIGKRVAIKIPRFGERRRAELLQRFRLEAQAASQIRHPNIADVTDCGSTPDGRFFFVMEFIDGIDVSQLVRREGALPVERTLLIAIQVCRALEAAHKAGIIHRDLKPSNVMLLRDRDHEVGDLVKVLDFGVAKFLRSDVTADRPDLTRLDAAVGTPKYMAPEQIERGQEIDFRVDTYGVGGLLYFMLSGGHAPIEGDTVEDIWRRKVSDEVMPIANWRSDLSPGVESIVARCLARDPAARPESMEILRRDLLLALESLRAVGSSVLPRLASSTAVVERNAGLGKRNTKRTLIVLGLGGLAAGLLAVVIDGRLDVGKKSPQVAALRSQSLGAKATENSTRTGEVAVARAPERSPAVFPALPKEKPTPSPGTGAAVRPIAPGASTAATPGAPRRAPGPGTTAPVGGKVAAAGALVTGRSSTSNGVDLVRGRSAPNRPAGKPQGSPAGGLQLAATSASPDAAKVPPAARPAYVQAELAWQEGKLTKAVMLAEKSIKAGAGAAGELLLGHIYREVGDYDKAKAAYQRSMRDQPGNASAITGIRKSEEAMRAKAARAANASYAPT
ncbi:MAG TPA: protein kinase, partial [Polyangia bacterium]